MISDSPVLLKKSAAAKILDISIASLDRLVSAGKLAKIQVSVRRVGILESDLNAYINTQRVGGANNAPAA
jgi:predicted site-specific integrase-resolvase